jgi:4-amino-4-deoxy-L-arabinose transferase-like glycosyltransferase
MTDRAQERRLVAQCLWLLLTLVFLLHFLPRVITQSMFFDGLIYASIARNMATDWVSLWDLRFSETLFPAFAEHPPLAMWMQAALFRLFGDTILVEKLFSTGLLLASGILLFSIVHRLLGRGREALHTATLALIFTLIAGRLAWTFSNNMLENTLILCTLAAILLVVRAEQEGDRRRRFCLAFAAGLAVAAAFLAKGPVGLFPLAGFAIWWVVYRARPLSETLLLTAVMVLALMIVAYVLFQIDAARDYFGRYLEGQVFSSLAGERGETGSRLKSLRTLVRMLVYPLLLAGLCLVLLRVFAAKKRPGAGEQCAVSRDARRKAALFLLLVAASASLPILASPRVWSFYFSPCLPFFGAAVAVWVAPPILGALYMLSFPVLRRLRFAMLAAAVLAALITLPKTGSSGEDSALISEARSIAGAACPSSDNCQTVVSTCPAVWQEWQLHGYLQRHHEISLQSASPGEGMNDVFLYRDTCGALDFSEYEAARSTVSGLIIYKRANNPT